MILITIRYYEFWGPTVNPKTCVVRQYPPPQVWGTAGRTLPGSAIRKSSHQAAGRLFHAENMPKMTTGSSRLPSILTSLPPQWNNSLQQCAAAILVFALATVLTQRAALGVVVLGMVRAFALLVVVAGGVMWPLAIFRAAQQTRRDFNDVQAKSLSPVPKSFRSSASFPVKLSQAEPVPSKAEPVPSKEDTPAPARESQQAPSSEAWPTHRSRPARDVAADAFLATPPTEADVEREAQEGSAEHASAMLSHLLLSGRSPAAGAFHAVVRAHAADGRPAQASAWLERMLAQKLRPDAHLFNAAMGAHFSAADTAGARALLDRMAQLQWPSLRWVQGHWASQLEEIDCC